MRGRFPPLRWLPRPSFDLPRDLLELDLGALHRPPRVVRPESDRVALTLRAQLEAECDRPAIRPFVRLDPARHTTRHSGEPTPHRTTVLDVGWDDCGNDREGAASLSRLA